MHHKQSIYISELFKKSLLSSFIILFVICCISNKSEAMNTKSTSFQMSRNWFQLPGDGHKNIFRAYAIAIDDNHNILGLANIFFLKCKKNNLYITVHFTLVYDLDGFKKEKRIPETKITFDNGSQVYNFKAEFYMNEFYVDLNKNMFNYLEYLWSHDIINLKMGPQKSATRVKISNDPPDNSFIDLLHRMIPGNPKNIKTLSYLDAFAHCLSKQFEVTDGVHWSLWGIIFCANCGLPSQGSTQKFLRVGQKDGTPYPTQQQCLQYRDGIVDTIRQRGLMASFVCIRVP